MRNKIILIILDGWGLRKEKKGNAIALAKTPFYDQLWKKYPHAILDAGETIGLPAGQVGTSEVNHMAIGAGRVVLQDLVRINKAIKDKSFFKNKAFLSVFDYVKKHDSRLHIKGLISPGGVHSHQNHIYALLKAAKKRGIKKVYVHAFTDGRDVLPKSAAKYIKQFEEEMKKLEVGKIASVCGRYYSMDRDHNWERTDKAFEMLVRGKGEKYKSVLEAIEASYKKGVTDEFIKPCIIDKQGVIKDNDGVIFANFRNDRPRQLAERFLKKGPKNLKYITLGRFNSSYPFEVAFPPLEIENILGEVISKAGLKQLRITETEKFAHITFFLNFKREDPFEGEDRIMLNSYSDIATHDERPEMRALDIAQEIEEDVKKENHNIIFTNLCNADMVGHTGNIKALKQIVPIAQKHGYQVIITADHGNAEEMLTSKGETVTAHSTNPVPFILISRKYKKLKKEKGSLIDVAPTVLRLLSLKKPKEMTGKILV